MADIFNWYDDLLQSRYGPQAQPPDLLATQQPQVQPAQNQWQSAPDTIPFNTDMTPVPDTGRGTYWDNARQAAGDIYRAGAGVAERFNKGTMNMLGLRAPGAPFQAGEIEVGPGMARLADAATFATGGLTSPLSPMAGTFRTGAQFARPAARQNVLAAYDAMLGDAGPASLPETGRWGPEAGGVRLSRQRMGALNPVPVYGDLAEAGPAAALPELEAAPFGTGHNMPPRAARRRPVPPEQPPALGFPQAKFPQYAEAYPAVGEPVPAIDKTTKKPYLEKGWTPEMEAFRDERLRIADDMKLRGYEPYFDVSQRQHVDPANYPSNVDTRAIVPGPRAKTTVEQEMATVGSDEARARLQAAYARGAAMPNTADWYAVKQIEDEFIKEYGVTEGRKMFQDRFANSMAATTGGADPEGNLLMAMYGNYIRNQPGGAYPAGAYEMPYPIGGRFAGGNMKQHQKLTAAGYGEANPKRLNFSRNFTGDPNVATMDEQMTRGMTPGINMPPKGRYGIYERVLAEEATKANVDPRRFQEVAWAGFKNMSTPSYKSGVPMMQTVNDMIERTRRLTGLPVEEVVRRGLVRGEIPMYGLLGAIGAGGLANQYGSEGL